MRQLISMLLFSLTVTASAYGNPLSDMVYKQVYSSAEVAARYSNSAVSAARREVKTEQERHASLSKFCFNMGGLMEISRTISQIAAVENPAALDDFPLRKEFAAALDELTRTEVTKLTILSYAYLTQYNTATNFCESPTAVNMDSENALGIAPEDFQKLLKLLNETVQVAYNVKHAVETASPMTAQSNPWLQDKKQAPK